jgi:hypothetical protein
MSTRTRLLVSPFTSFVLMTVALALTACSDSDSNDAGPSDMTAPTVALNTAAATVARTAQLAATATDDRGVARVEFLVDGTVIGSDTSSPFSFDWNTSGVADGTHSVTARAADAAGNTTTSTAVTFTVKNNFTYSVVLSGAEEIPATTTLAAGNATLNVNIGTGAISGNLLLTGVTATAAHVHDGFAGQNGTVAIPLEESTTTPGTWGFAPSAALTTAQVDKLLAGGLYLNAHSDAYTGGEVRGQILPDIITVAFATLEGLQEVPEVTTNGAAQGAVTVNRDSGRATIHVTTRNLLSHHEPPAQRRGRADQAAVILHAGRQRRACTGSPWIKHPTVLRGARRSAIPEHTHVGERQLAKCAAR